MSQDEFNQKVIDHLIALGNRLESIERMLGEESKQFLSESAIPSPGMILIEDEPEWRPMSTAPKDRDIEVKVRGEVYTAWYYGKEEWNVSACILHEVYISGWRPL